MPIAFRNPFRPGAGHPPPYLAGREQEQGEFRKLLDQDVILKNLVLTGLRGVGKTVLLETFKPLARVAGWAWAETDLSESTSMTEASLALRVITELSVVTSPIVVSHKDVPQIGFRSRPTRTEIRLDHPTLMALYEDTPGLPDDKLKQVLQTSWEVLRRAGIRGLVLAYDEAQYLGNHPATGEYPLSLLLTVFQSIQRKGIPFMLVFTGLPTLFPRLVEARTFAERMFRVISLERLGDADSRAAIERPMEKAGCPVRFDATTVDAIVDASAGYPYFLQFLSRGAFDVALTPVSRGQSLRVPIEEIVHKLDAEFFAGRWARLTDRQRELMRVIASLERKDDEFTVQEIVERSPRMLTKPFSSSHTHQILGALGDAGLVFRNRHGKYAFALPLLGAFIRRQAA